MVISQVHAYITRIHNKHTCTQHTSVSLLLLTIGMSLFFTCIKPDGREDGFTLSWTLEFDE